MKVGRGAVRAVGAVRTGWGGKAGGTMRAVRAAGILFNGDSFS